MVIPPSKSSSSTAGRRPRSASRCSIDIVQIMNKDFNQMARLNWERYPDFSEHEFADGGPHMNHDFMSKLQTARSICRELCKEAGVSEVIFSINTGSRSEDNNRQVGGKPDSTHLYGRACDINADSSRDRYFIVKSLLLAGFTRIGIYKDDETYIHVDNGEQVEETEDPANVLW